MRQTEGKHHRTRREESLPTWTSDQSLSLLFFYPGKLNLTAAGIASIDSLHTHRYKTTNTQIQIHKHKNTDTNTLMINIQHTMTTITSTVTNHHDYSHRLRHLPVNKICNICTIQTGCLKLVRGLQFLLPRRTSRGKRNLGLAFVKTNLAQPLFGSDQDQTETNNISLCQDICNSALTVGRKSSQ